MFNNDNPKTNGEYLFYLNIKDKINIIFDIGCRKDSEFIDFQGEVHYFDPVKEFIDDISKQVNKNLKSYFNNFGLGEENKNIYYYPKYQSFYNRVNSCGICDDKNKICLTIKTAKSYVEENNIDSIDFIKIDTEGYDFNVLKGFENYLEKFGFCKFSYLTNKGTKLIDNFTDHYKYCNIVCVNKKYDIFF